VEQRPLAVVRTADSFDIGVQIFFELVMAGHFIQLAVLFVEAQPPALFLRKVILDRERADRTNAREGKVYVITAIMARSRRPTTVETSMPVSSAVASSEDSTGVRPFVTEWRGPRTECAGFDGIT
jgi:hypothetical protein